MRFDIGDFNENFSSIRENRAKISGSLHEDLSRFVVAGDVKSP